MRLLHRASLVFLLNDIYSKSPITTAVILCNGKQNPYTRKDDGHYVFSNLYPGDYTINISCIGYVPIELKINLKENETIVMPITMSYSMNNNAMQRLTRFNLHIEHEAQPLKNEKVMLRLCNELSFLKLIEPVAAKSDAMKLNLEDFTPGILGQSYVYKVREKNYEFTITSFDQEKKNYILRDFVQKEVPIDGKFYAVWHLNTDSQGRIIMPYISQFMQGQTVSFECTFNDFQGTAEIDITGKEQSCEMLYADILLSKMEPPEEEPDETEESEGTDESGKAEGTGESGEADEADENDETDETEETDKTEESEEIDKTEESEETDESEESEGTGESEESGESEETDESEESEGTGESEESGESEETDESEETEESEETDESEETEESEETDESEESEGTGESEESGESEETDESEETEESEETDENDETEETEETDKTEETDETEDME